ncbi:hypothetical protein LTR84_011758 [Exophiala bonariae]|uniref:Uncharacterized protein n=1 Tax=Exophiala bonariae TaxID=1690606 RepID=A0AAV9NGW5_9EURO|nr:hypothetical protein LTR84_011758 [Exophiala bonariae]
MTGTLAQPLDAETKGRIGRAFFGETFEMKGGLEAFQDYFDFYENELSWLKASLPPGADQIPGIIPQTHDELLTFALMLGDNAHRDRREARAMLKSQMDLLNVNDWELDRSIDTTLRLWLQINVREAGSGTSIPEVHWEDDQSLEHFLGSLFPVEEWDLGARERRLNPQFTVANMVEICDLKISWTTSLEDHLRLERWDKQKVLWIFPHKRTLCALLAEAGSPSGRKCPIPLSVIRETIQTLDLLFPFWDQHTKAFLKREGQTFHEIIAAPQHGRRMHLLDFPHWKVRLLDVYEEIYQSPPVSITQLWRDRRNPQLWSTFWTAVVILLLTLLCTVFAVISTIASSLQAWLAWKAWQAQLNSSV